MADDARIVRERVLGGGDAAGDRYRLHERLGSGTTGAVFRATDADLEREVAIKVILDAASRDAAAELIREARLAASIDHPNVVPVYDVGRTEDGRAWMAMRRIEGRTLADEIARAADGRDAVAITDRVRLAAIVVQVCNAIGSAHARGILHRDVKPANILLGAFGEVLVVDWGSASRHDGSRAATGGSPWYMSPALARGEPATTACDIYAIGATLLHALLLRAPLDAAEDETFWRRKRAGELDAPTGDERARVPRHLLAIALKAMRQPPLRAYPTVGALAEDLQAWQAGQPVSACGDTLAERSRRALRRHGQRLLAVGVIAASLVAAASVVFGERLKEYATWGTPTVVERFADDGWRERWRVVDGDWRREDGRLISTGEHGSMLVWPHRLSGATAIEYEGEVLPGSKPCDISLIWARDIDASVNSWHSLRDPVKVQIGAYDGAYTAIIVPGEQHVAYHAFKPVPGRRHRVRIEIVDDRLTLAVDGQRLCSYRDPLPLTDGYAALYGYYPGKAFGEVRISSLGIPERVPPTVLGDGLAARGEWDAARDAYARVADGFAGQALGEQARYRAGLCEYRATRFADAFATWERVADPRLIRLIGVHRLERRLAADDVAGAGPDLATACADDDEDVRERARGLWCRAVATGSDLVTRHAQPWVPDLLALRERAMPDARSTERLHVDGLYACRRYEEILARFPRQRLRCAAALTCLGRTDEVLRDYADQRSVCAYALALTGRWDELRTRMPDEVGNIGDWPLGLRPWAPGGGDAPGLGALLADGPAAVPATARGEAYLDALCRLHAHEPLAIAEGMPPALRDRALIAAGRGDELFDGGCDRDDFARRDAAALRAIAASARGDHAEAARWLERGARGMDPIDVGWFEQVLAPFLRELAGERGALARTCERVLAAEGDRDVGRARWRALVLLGRADDAAFLAQPLRAQADAELLLLHALRADVAGDAAGAAHAYAAYLRLPTWRRAGWLPDPADALARARVNGAHSR